MRDAAARRRLSRRMRGLKAAPSLKWSDRTFTIRRDDVAFVDRLYARELVTEFEYKRLRKLVRNSRLTVRVVVPNATFCDLRCALARSLDKPA